MHSRLILSTDLAGFALFLVTLRRLCVLGVSAVEDVNESFTAETQRTQRIRRDLMLNQYNLTEILFQIKLFHKVP